VQPATTVTSLEIPQAVIPAVEKKLAHHYCKLSILMIPITQFLACHSSELSGFFDTFHVLSWI